MKSRRNSLGCLTYGCQVSRRARVMSVARYVATVPDP